MGSNVSQGKRRARIAASMLADFKGSDLTVDCGSPGCARGRRFRIADLAGVYPGLTVGQALGKMRCQTRGQGVREAVMAGTESGRRTQIRLLGPGAYG